MIVGTCRQKDQQDTFLYVQNIEDSHGAWGSLQTSGRSGQYKKLWGVLMEASVWLRRVAGEKQSLAAAMISETGIESGVPSKVFRTRRPESLKVPIEVSRFEVLKRCRSSGTWVRASEWALNSSKLSIFEPDSLSRTDAPNIRRSRVLTVSKR